MLRESNSLCCLGLNNFFDHSKVFFSQFFDMQENNNFETIINTWRRLSGEQIEPSVLVSMSGDSPDYQSQKKKEEETLLVPERAKVTSVAVNTGITAASIDMPPDGSGPANPEEKQEFIRRDSKDSKEAAGDTNENNKIDKDYLENTDDFGKKSPEKKWDNEKQGDKVDSVYLRPPPPHKARSTTSTNEEEDCGIKCLYYTLQCCDCVLM